MYELTVERTFSAAHAIVIRGEREPLHGHDWTMTMTVRGSQLDQDGLLCDFHELERLIDSVIAPLRNSNLNETPPFDQLNPTAEHVAQHLATSIAAVMPDGLTLDTVSVTEAPGCQATYRAS